MLRPRPRRRTLRARRKLLALVGSLVPVTLVAAVVVFVPLDGRATSPASSRRRLDERAGSRAAASRASGSAAPTAPLRPVAERPAAKLDTLPQPEAPLVSADHAARLEAVGRGLPESERRALVASSLASVRDARLPDEERERALELVAVADAGRSPEVEAAIVALVDDAATSATLRRAGTETLAWCRGDAGWSALGRLAARDRDLAVRRAALFALATARPEEAVALLSKLAKEDPDPGLRATAREAFSIAAHEASLAFTQDDQDPATGE